MEASETPRRLPPETVLTDPSNPPQNHPELSQRDLAVLRLVSRFKQVTSAQVHELLFSELRSRTPAERSLRRLTATNYLHRLERRLVGGSKGGSGQYVYSLGRRGFFAFYEGRWQVARTVSHHTLAITELYVRLRRFETAGSLGIAGLSTEPDCWAVIGRTELKPDLYVEIERPGGRRNKLWFEVDMGTEGQRQVRAKLDAVVRAYEQASDDNWPIFPVTVWSAVDAEREKELRWLIEQLPAEAQPLFRVCQADSLADVLGL